MLFQVVDLYDRDSMIYADGAGATILEETAEEGGILSHCTITYTAEKRLILFFMENHTTVKV